MMGRYVLVLFLITLGGSLGYHVPSVYGQALSYTTVASPVTVQGEVINGDVVSYDAETGTVHPSALPADEMMYGVVVTDPVMYIYETTTTDRQVPVVRYGEALVNVTDIGGEIRAGDLVTTSVVEGKGKRISRDEGAYALGFALEDMRLLDQAPSVVRGKEVRMGTVPVALRIGPYVTKDGASYLASSSVLGITVTERFQERSGLDLFKLMRYLLGSLVAISAVVIAARRFGDTFKQSIVSVGRNPLARSQIRAMVLWNALFIILISSIGLGVGIAIVIAP